MLQTQMIPTRFSHTMNWRSSGGDETIFDLIIAHAHISSHWVIFLSDQDLTVFHAASDPLFCFV